MMRSSPRRPLILRRRRLNLPSQDGVGGAGSPAQGHTTVSSVIGGQKPDCGGNRGLDEPKPVSPEVDPLPAGRGSASSFAPRSPAESSSLSGVKIMGHPTIPDTQLVIIPPDSDVESIIQALTVRGKESGGPNKFILLTGNSSLHSQVERLGLQSKAEEIETIQLEATGASSLHHTPKEETEDVASSCVSSAPPVEGQELDDSLTNIHWLGKMSSDGLGPRDPKPDAAEEEEDCSPERDPIKVEEEPLVPASPQSWRVIPYERPPYSYMALIQFAINSTATKRMTLKDIYTWIEDHFPYFKHVAKPGWKNSIRHNLSLHDMFVRETPSNNNKISYWTIHPQANRCLTLDQVFKASGSSSSACSEPRPVTPEQSGVVQSVAGSTRALERKMKPLLPRIDSYLIPVQFPITQPLIFSPLETFTPDPGATDGPRSSKRVKIAPKILLEMSDPSPLVLTAPPQAEPDPAELWPTLTAQSQRVSGSRRKQQLVTPRCSEPELVLPDSSASDSGLDTEFSFLQDTHPPDGPSQLTLDGPSQLTLEGSSQLTLEGPSQLTHDEPSQLTHDGPSLLAHDGPSLLAHDGPSLLAHDGPSLLAHDGPSLLAHDGPSLLAHDGPSLLAHDGPSLLAHDGPSLLAHDGPSLLAHDGPSLLAHDGPSLLAHDGPSLLAHDGPSHLTHDEGYSFKTPVKDKFMKPPSSSTPSRLPCLQPWESPSPLTRDPLPDFSPVRIPRGAALTPFKDSYGTLSFWETPFKDLPYFGSPPDTMAALSPFSPQVETLETPTGARKQRRCSKELQVGGSTNRSLLEGLVLDTKDESLSKILLDISFGGLEEDDPGGTDSSYWGQLFNELR
ncbi:forkhead box protein M1 [Ranitomeya variabilis]|uniref:forkhead box protein M1 n=1 Tax=Ranitomeya variabilis TaxID=490064 RepID=UPI004056663C